MGTAAAEAASTREEPELIDYIVEIHQYIVKTMASALLAVLHVPVAAVLDALGAARCRARFRDRRREAVQEIWVASAESEVQFRRVG